MNNIFHSFRKQAVETPLKSAIIDHMVWRDRVCTYKELLDSSAQGASHLESLGIQKGDRVWVMQPMSIELYQILLSIFRIGAVALFIDPGYSPRQIADCLEAGQPKVLIANWKAFGFLHKTLAKFSGEHALSIGYFPFKKAWRTYLKFPMAKQIAPMNPSDPALLTFTSGSTGKPKGILRTHSFLTSQHLSIEESIKLETDETDLSTMPIFVLANLASGLTSIIASGNVSKPGHVKARPILRQIEKFRIQRVSAAPAFLERILTYCETHKKAKSRLNWIKKVHTGGGPVTVPFLQKLENLFPNALIEAVYGSTEAEPIAILPANNLEFEGGTGIPAGNICAHLDFCIIEETDNANISSYSKVDFDALKCGTKEIGEIVVSGNHVVQGYMDPSRNRDTKIQVGDTIWHRTGDAGYLDETHQLHLCGRCSAKVQSGDQTLYPFVVESLFHADPNMTRCALINVSGNAVLAIQPSPACGSIENLQQDCSSKLRTRGWEIIIPKIMKKIPVDNRHNSKVDYVRLKAFLSSQ